MARCPAPSHPPPPPPPPPPAQGHHVMVTVDTSYNNSNTSDYAKVGNKGCGPGAAFFKAAPAASFWQAKRKALLL